MEDIHVVENVKEFTEKNSKEDTKSDTAKYSTVDNTEFPQIQQTESSGNRKKATDTLQLTSDDSRANTTKITKNSCAQSQQMLTFSPEDETYLAKIDNEREIDIDNIENSGTQFQQRDTLSQADKERDLTTNKKDNGREQKREIRATNLQQTERLHQNESADIMKAKSNGKEKNETTSTERNTHREEPLNKGDISGTQFQQRDTLSQADKERDLMTNKKDSGREQKTEIRATNLQQTERLHEDESADIKRFDYDNRKLRIANKSLRKRELANMKKIKHLSGEVETFRNREKHAAENNVKLSVEIRRLETEIVENQKKLKTVSAKNEELHSACLWMQNKISELNAKESDLDNALEKQTNKSDALQKEQQSLKCRHKILTDRNDELNTNLYTQERLITDLKTEQNKAKEEMKKYICEVENLNAVKKELTESKKQLQIIVDSYQPTYEDLLQKEIKWTNEWHTLLNQQDAVRAERRQVDETRDKLEEKAAEINKKHKVMLENEAKLETTIVNLKSSLTASQDYADSIKRDLDTAKKDIINYQSTLKDRNTECDALKARIQNTECSLGNAALVLTETQRQLDVVTTSTVALREENRKLVEERVQLTSQMIKERENTGKLNVFISKQ